MMAERMPVIFQSPTRIAVLILTLPEYDRRVGATYGTISPLPSEKFKGKAMAGDICNLEVADIRKIAD